MATNELLFNGYRGRNPLFYLIYIMPSKGKHINLSVEMKWRGKMKQGFNRFLILY